MNRPVWKNDLHLLAPMLFADRWATSGETVIVGGIMEALAPDEIGSVIITKG